jgi:hypothetical protein
MKGMKRKRETLRKKERERERSHFPYRYKRSDEPVAKKWVMEEEKTKYNKDYIITTSFINILVLKAIKKMRC